jgi:hypothetical protein
MGGKSRKTGGVSKALIQRIKAQQGEKCINKSKTSNSSNLGLIKENVSTTVRKK